MITPAPAKSSNAGRNTAVAVSFGEAERGQPYRLLEGELADLYGAILIVVPLALFLKSLWF